MKLLGIVLAVFAMLGLMVSVAGAVYASELLFIGAGTHNDDVNPKSPFGHGDYGAFAAEYGLDIGVPGEAGGMPASSERMNIARREETPVPEPVTLLLFGSGLLGAALLRRRRK